VNKTYLTYSRETQDSIIQDKLSGMPAGAVCKKHNVSVYTLYKILHMNGKMPIPSQAAEGKGSAEGVEHSDLSPNNNDHQERPTSTWKNYGSIRHIKIKHVCLRCKRDFYARNRGKRTRFCSPKCKSLYRTEQNSFVKECDNCGKKFRVKKSLNSIVRCEECRKLKLRAPSSKAARDIGIWMSEKFLVEKEKAFEWLLDAKKPKGRFKLDYFLPQHNVAIEYDGEQHFKPCFTSRWESVDKVKYRDLLKKFLCEKHGIHTIHFSYDEPITKEYVLMKIYAELNGKRTFRNSR
jgi:very-short-patch-repair endonuclease/DNA-directed RNA polymerase subunit RPC12/RpoP